jgi:hypothetical protein
MGATSKGTRILEQIIFSVKKRDRGRLTKPLSRLRMAGAHDENRRACMKKLAAAIFLALLAVLAAAGE